MGTTLSKLFYREKTITGIDIGQTAIKMMSLDTKRGEVVCFGSVDIDPERMQAAIKDGDSAFIVDTLTDLLRNKVIGTFGSKKVVVSIPASQVFTRTLALPLKAERALKSAVELEAEQYIPVPVSSLIIDYQVIGRTDTELSVLMCAAPRKVVTMVTEATERLGLEAVAIEPSMMAVGRLLTATENAGLPSIIVDIGAVVTDIAAVDNNSIRVTGSAPIGGNIFTLNIAKSLNTSLEQAHQMKVLYGLSYSTRQKKLTKALAPDLDTILSEVKKLIRYYNDRLGGEKLEQLLIVGSGANIPGIGEYFTNTLMMAARVADPWQKINFGHLSPPARQVKPRYITVAGAASVTQEELWK